MTATSGSVSDAQNIVVQMLNEWENPMFKNPAMVRYVNRVVHGKRGISKFGLRETEFVREISHFEIIIYQ